MDPKGTRVLALSNASTNMFPDNKAQRFKNQLPEPLDLDGHWEIGLTNIQYPATWYNITEDSVFVLKAFIRTAVDAARPAPHGEGNRMRLECSFNKGYYSSMADLVAQLTKSINDKFKEYMDTTFLLPGTPNVPQEATRAPYFEDESRSDLLSFKYKTNTKLVIMTPKIRFMKLVVKRGLDLWKRMGFSIDKVDTEYGINFEGVTSSSQVVLSNRFPKMYLCCDIVEESYVGTKRTPLVRSIHVPQTKKPFIMSRFSPPEFVPVSKGYINTIEYWMEDDEGELVPFQSGKLIATFKLRRVS